MKPILKQSLAMAATLTVVFATVARVEAQTTVNHEGYFSGGLNHRFEYGPYGYLLHDRARVDFFQRDYGPRVFHPYFQRRQLTHPGSYIPWRLRPPYVPPTEAPSVLP